MMKLTSTSPVFIPPAIAPVPEGAPRPRWSVMIPTFNCAKYLRQTLESVLAQDPGPEQMQIEVVDDCSTKDDPEAVVRERGKGRVAFFRKPRNEGAIPNFNTCIQRSRGHLVHILHGDDYVLGGFYERIGAMAARQPDVALIASRSFVVDEGNVITGITNRLREMEGGTRSLDSFFYGTPIQPPGIVVQRSFYETHGGFLLELIHTADCEMWARAVELGRGVATPEVLACYRTFAANDSGRLARTAENLRDMERLNRLFAARYSGFDCRRAAQRVSLIALVQAERFDQNGDAEAAQANWDYWKQSTPARQRWRRLAGQLVRNILI